MRIYAFGRLYKNCMKNNGKRMFVIVLCDFMLKPIQKKSRRVCFFVDSRSLDQFGVRVLSCILSKPLHIVRESGICVFVLVRWICVHLCRGFVYKDTAIQISSNGFQMHGALSFCSFGCYFWRCALHATELGYLSKRVSLLCKMENTQKKCQERSWC